MCGCNHFERERSIQQGRNIFAGCAASVQVVPLNMLVMATLRHTAPAKRCACTCGFCSAQPGFGKVVLYGAAKAATSVPFARKRPARMDSVPPSMPITSGSLEPSAPPRSRSRLLRRRTSARRGGRLERSPTSVNAPRLKFTRSTSVSTKLVSLFAAIAAAHCYYTFFSDLLFAFAFLPQLPALRPAP